MKAAVKALESFFTTWALMKASRMEPGNILTLIFYLFTFVFFRFVDRITSQTSPDVQKKTARVSKVLAVVFTLLYTAVDYPFYIQTLTSPLFRAGILCSVFFGFSVLFFHLLRLMFYFTTDKKRLARHLFVDHISQTSELPKTVGAKARLSSFYQKHTGLCAFLLCMICWLPYFLYQYPGVMTPDSLNQFEQVLGVIPYSNHHPWMHTLLIKLLYSIGYKLTGSMLIALSFYTFFQMCALAGSICYFINTLRLFQIKPFGCFLVTLFYALIPYHAVYSVTIWKDILFAAALLCFSCSLLRFLRSGQASTSDISISGYAISGFTVSGFAISDLVMFVLTGLTLCLFRSNGWYAFLLCLPFLFVFFRKKARIFYPALLLIFCTAAVIKYPVMNAFHVTQPDLVESLSIPIQQITAVICNDRELTEQELALIEKVVDLTYIKELYDPHYADNIKELVRAGNQAYLADHKGDFLRLWARLGLRYPGDYLTAYIRQTYGYWYPDSFYLVAEAEGVSATSLGVSHTPLIRGPLVIKAKEISIKLGGMLPLYGTLWSMGVALWAMLFCIGNAFVRNEKPKLMLFLPSLALLFTVLIATPVATEFRYVYFMVFALPFYMAAAILPIKNNVSDKGEPS